MANIRIGLLNKRRGNFGLQAKFIGAENVVDTTDAEVAHHADALMRAGYYVRQIRWGPNLIRDLQEAQVDLVFNVSSLAEVAILEDLDIMWKRHTIPIYAERELGRLHTVPSTSGKVRAGVHVSSRTLKRHWTEPRQAPRFAAGSTMLIVCSAAQRSHRPAYVVSGCISVWIDRNVEI